MCGGVDCGGRRSGAPAVLSPLRGWEGQREPISEAMSALTTLFALCAVASGAKLASVGNPASAGVRHISQLQPLLRCRGGATSPEAAALPAIPRKKSSSPLSAAARKLCTQPGLVAASGTSGSTFIFANHVRGIVFGGLDGILTTFALLAAVAGSKHTSTSLTLVIGISTVLADALSMGAGEYLSAKAEHELSGGGAHPTDEPSPLEKALAMFLAFAIFGSLPLVGCVVSAAVTKATGLPIDEFGISVAITALTLFGLGGIKSQFGEGVWWKAGFEVSTIGGLSATIAYITARVIEKLMGES